MPGNLSIGDGSAAAAAPHGGSARSEGKRDLCTACSPCQAGGLDLFRAGAYSFGCPPPAAAVFIAARQDRQIGVTRQLGGRMDGRVWARLAGSTSAVSELEQVELNSCSLPRTARPPAASPLLSALGVALWQMLTPTTLTGTDSCLWEAARCGTRRPWTRAHQRATSAVLLSTCPSLYL